MPCGIACFGASHIDIKAMAAQRVRLGSSNPVSLRRTPGGVARNVAEMLARLGCTVMLAGRVGDDADGRALVEALAGLGVDTAFLGRSATGRTAGYTALLEPDGELVVALADMDIYDELTPSVLAPAAEAAAAIGLWFVDANLPADSLAWLLAGKPPGRTVAADAVSVPKSTRLKGLLDRIDLLFANRDEAAALSGRPIAAALDVFEAARALRARGVGAAVVTMGRDGVFVAGREVEDYFPALPVSLRDVTGAGDALIAGTLYGLAQGRRLAEAVMLGLAGAAFALEIDDTVNRAVTGPGLLARAGLAR